MDIIYCSNCPWSEDCELKNCWKDAESRSD